MRPEAGAFHRIDRFLLIGRGGAITLKSASTRLYRTEGLDDRLRCAGQCRRLLDDKNQGTMELARQILVYITSAALVPVVRIVKGVILLLVPMKLIGKRTGLVTHAALNILLNSGLVYVVVLLSEALRVQPVLYMLMPAIFFTVLRCRRQRERFRSGHSMEESLHKSIARFQPGQEGSDYRALLIRREYVNEITALLGFLLGALMLWWLKYSVTD